MRPILVCLIICVLTACSGSDSTPQPLDEGSSPTSSSGADLEAAEIAAFSASRDQICAEAGGDVTEIAAEWIDAEGASDADVVVGIRKIMARIEQAQGQLDQLSVPTSLVAFVTQDDARREKRIRLFERQIVAFEEGRPNLTSLFEQMTQLDGEGESVEDTYGLVHCV